MRNARAEWCVECGMRKACNQGVLYCLFFAPPAWIFHSNVCSSCLTSLHVNVKQINELNVCWNMVFRRIFQYNKLESVRAVIDGCGRLDVKHLILLRRIQLYRRIFYTNDNVLHKLFCALMLSDCMGTITAWYQFLHATQPGMSICNFGLILLSDVLTNWYNFCIFFLSI